MVRELGSVRRETVRSLSTAVVESCEESPFVREDQGELTSGVPAVLPRASLGSYVGNR